MAHPESPWTHAMCRSCWEARHPDGRIPHRLLKAPQETCCYCGHSTSTGIYVREAPVLVHPQQEDTL